MYRSLLPSRLSKRHPRLSPARGEGGRKGGRERGSPVCHGGLAARPSARRRHPRGPRRRGKSGGRKVGEEGLAARSPPALRGGRAGSPRRRCPAAEEEEPEGGRQGGREAGREPAASPHTQDARQGRAAAGVRRFPLRPRGAPPPRGALPASRGQMWTQQLDGEEGRGKEGRGTAASPPTPPAPPPPPPRPPPLPGMRAGCSGRPRLRAGPALGWGWRNLPRRQRGLAGSFLSPPPLPLPCCGSGRRWTLSG